jgi:hypothetical protein
MNSKCSSRHMVVSPKMPDLESERNTVCSALRQARSRKARAEAGGKQIAVMLTPQAAAKLAEHIAKGESITAVVNRLMCDSNPH